MPKVYPAHVQRQHTTHKGLSLRKTNYSMHGFLLNVEQYYRNVGRSSHGMAQLFQSNDVCRNMIVWRAPPLRAHCANRFRKEPHGKVPRLPRLSECAENCADPTPKHQVDPQAHDAQDANSLRTCSLSPLSAFTGCRSAGQVTRRATDARTRWLSTVTTWLSSLTTRDQP